MGRPWSIYPTLFHQHVVPKCKAIESCFSLSHPLGLHRASACDSRKLVIFETLVVVFGRRAVFVTRRLAGFILPSIPRDDCYGFFPKETERDTNAAALLDLWSPCVGAERRIPSVMSRLEVCGPFVAINTGCQRKDDHQP